MIVVASIEFICPYEPKMARHDRVCILSDGETEELRAGNPVYCNHHKHISAEEAFGMTAPIFMQRNGQASSPVCEWVGPKHVRYILQHAWVTKKSSAVPCRGGVMRLRVTTKQLVAGV